MGVGVCMLGAGQGDEEAAHNTRAAMHATPAHTVHARGAPKMGHDGPSANVGRGWAPPQDAQQLGDTDPHRHALPEALKVVICCPAYVALHAGLLQTAHDVHACRRLFGAALRGSHLGAAAWPTQLQRQLQRPGRARPVNCK